MVVSKSRKAKRGVSKSARASYRRRRGAPWGKGVVEEIIMLAENLRNANGTRVENARFAARHTDAREVQKNVK